jgi:hypothetical protein
MQGMSQQVVSNSMLHSYEDHKEDDCGYRNRGNATQ